MLVLTRKTDESIMINDDIQIKILQIKNGQVRVAIKADSKYRILREELYNKVTEASA